MTPYRISLMNLRRAVVVLTLFRIFQKEAVKSSAEDVAKIATFIVQSHSSIQILSGWSQKNSKPTTLIGAMLIGTYIYKW